MFLLIMNDLGELLHEWTQLRGRLVDHLFQSAHAQLVVQRTPEDPEKRADQGPRQGPVLGSFWQ
jgi:hypothetical protein